MAQEKHPAILVFPDVLVGRMSELPQKRVGKVFYGDRLAGHIERRDDGGYCFVYQTDYLARPDARPVSITLPLRREEYNSPVLFPFFSGLLAEGNLKDLQCRLRRIDPDDDFTRLLKTTRHDVIGAVTVEEVAP